MSWWLCHHHQKHLKVTLNQERTSLCNSFIHLFLSSHSLSNFVVPRFIFLPPFSAPSPASIFIPFLPEIHFLSTSMYHKHIFWNQDSSSDSRFGSSFWSIQFSSSFFAKNSSFPDQIYALIQLFKIEIQSFNNFPLFNYLFLYPSSRISFLQRCLEMSLPIKSLSRIETKTNEPSSNIFNE